MPKKISKPDMLSVLESRIVISRKIMERERDEIWKPCRQLYEGDHWVGFSEAQKRKLHTINLVWSNIRTKLASLYFRNPKFDLKPKRPEFEGPLQQLTSAVLNYYAEKAMLKPIARNCVQAAFTDMGIITWGCDTQFNEVARHPTIDLQSLGIGGGQPLSLPKRDSFYFKRIMADHFFPDHSSGEQVFEKLPGFGVLELMRKEEVVKKYGLSKKKADSLEASASTADMDDLKDYYQQRNVDNKVPPEVRDELGRVAVYKYYDNERQKFFVFCKNLNDFLFYQDYEDNPPYAVLKFNEKTSGFYPIPEVMMLKDPQRMIEVAMSMLSEHMKRSARKIQAPKKLLDEKAKEALENATTGVLVELEGQAGQLIQPIDMGQADSSIFGNIQQQQAFFELIAGMSTSRMGGGSKKLTATAESIIEKYINARISDATSLLTDFMEIVGNGFNNCVQRNLLLPDVTKITTPEGAMMWMQYIPQLDLVGDYECKVTIGDTAPKDDALERAQWIDLLGVVASSPIIMMSPQIMEETLNRFNIDSPVLRNAFKQLGQFMMQQQMMGLMQGAGQPGGGKPTPSKTGQTAGNNIKVGG